MKGWRSKERREIGGMEGEMGGNEGQIGRVEERLGMKEWREMERTDNLKGIGEETEIGSYEGRKTDWSMSRRL